MLKSLFSLALLPSFFAFGNVQSVFAQPQGALSPMPSIGELHNRCRYSIASVRSQLAEDVGLQVLESLTDHHYPEGDFALADYFENPYGYHQHFPLELSFVFFPPANARYNWSQHRAFFNSATAQAVLAKRITDHCPGIFRVSYRQAQTQQGVLWGQVNGRMVKIRDLN
jgi:hypothetical protein